MEHFLGQGLISDSKVLDIRQVDVWWIYPLSIDYTYILTGF